ncbi:Hypothetical protein D9617_24g017470 [Elsinoe fawcettii]|nr:Hypothetical protein D9617_24g017470 [Elsinoe fawcettii]
MQSQSLLVLSLLTASTWAFPGAHLFQRAACNADNCLRAVRASSAKPFPSSATADCSSFFRKTVTPCPITTTETATSFVTAPVSTITVTASTDATTVITTGTTVTSVVTTNQNTLTITTPSITIITNTITTTTTVTSALARRDINTDNVRPLPEVHLNTAHLQKRSPVVSCLPSTTAPSRVPTYASACSGTVRYSSACSCAGITQAFTTIPAVTVTSTSTTTTTTTPLATSTRTNTISNTITVTSVVPTTFDTTVATVTVPSPVTITTSITVTATATCNAYRFAVTGGSRAGQYINGGTPDPNDINYGFLRFTTDLASASPFVIRPNGRVYGNNIYGWITQSGPYYILQMTDASQSFYGVPSVTCSVSNGGTSFPNAVGKLSCRQADTGGAIDLARCPSLSIGDDLFQITPGTAGTFDCEVLELVAIPTTCPA